MALARTSFVWGGSSSISRDFKIRSSVTGNAVKDFSSRKQGLERDLVPLNDRLRSLSVLTIASLQVEDTASEKTPMQWHVTSVSFWKILHGVALRGDPFELIAKCNVAEAISDHRKTITLLRQRLLASPG